MVNTEIAAAMKCLYYSLVNEIDSHIEGKLDENSISLAVAVKTTHKEFCEPEDQIP